MSDPESLPLLAQSVIMPQLAAGEIRHLGDGSAFGNSKGLDFLDEMKARMNRHGIRFQQHTYLIGQMTAQSEKYIAIRQRFLEAFSRDILDSRSPDSRQIITVDNVRAHKEDCVTDAQLYRDGRRKDEDLIIRLYGLPWLIEVVDRDD